MNLGAAQQRLREFADAEADSSPLYAHIAAHAAGDDDIAGLLAAAPDPDPELLFAVAHRLVQADPIHPITRYYQTMGGFDGVDAETWPLVRNFLLERAATAGELIASRRVRGDDVARAAVLYPAIAAVAKQAGGQIALLEVGCGAGLLLGLDRYGYRYQCDGGEQFTAGPAKASVGLHCAVTGGGFGKPAKKVTIGARIGLDADPIDASDEDELAWLEACVRADQPERARQLRAAAAAQRKWAPELIAGDIVDDLASTAERLPPGLPLVVMNSNVMGHLSEIRRDAYLAALATLAGDHPLWWVSHEPYCEGLTQLIPGRSDLEPAAGESVTSALSIGRWAAGEPAVEVLATTDPAGQRMNWRR